MVANSPDSSIRFQRNARASALTSVLSGLRGCPSKKELSSRLGISERQVQRYITDLEREGLLRRHERYGEHGGRQTNMYDLQGLVDKLAEIEPEFREARELARKSRKAAASPGWRPKKKTGADKDGPS